MTSKISEKGPWVVNEWPSRDGHPKKIVLQSDDFTHDVALIIDGDFGDHETKLEYAQQLASRMNRMPEE